MKKSGLFRRCVAMALVVALLGSNLTLEAMAGEAAACADETHEHTAACYETPEKIGDTAAEKAADEPAAEEPEEVAAEPAQTERQTLPGQLWGMLQRPAVSAEPAGEASTKDEVIQANFALQEWKARRKTGRITDDLTVTLDGIVYTVSDDASYDAVYGAVYARLQTYAEAWTDVTEKIKITDTKIFKLTGTANKLNAIVTIEKGGTVILLLDSGYAKLNLGKTGKFLVKGGVLSIQGKDEATELSLDANGGFTLASNGYSISNKTNQRDADNNNSTTAETLTENVIQVRAGKTFLEYAVMENVVSSNGNTSTRSGAISIDGSAEVDLFVLDSRFYKCVGKGAGGFGTKAADYDGTEVFFYNTIFSNCVSTGSSNNSGGGAVRAGSGSTARYYFEQCTFTNNLAMKHTSEKSGYNGGGAVRWNSNSAGVLNGFFNNCTFSGNKAHGNGGAVLAFGGLQLTNSSLYQNKATVSGGGIYVGSFSDVSSTDSSARNASVVLGSGTQIYENEIDLSVKAPEGADAVVGSGGGVYFNVAESKNKSGAREAYNLELTIDGAKIYDNKAKYGAGVAMCVKFNYLCGVYVQGTSEIYSNEATLDGGAVYISANSMAYDQNRGFIISGGTVYGNTAERNGGAVYLNNGNFTMTGGTMKGNTATANGGATYISSGSFTMSGGNLGVQNEPNRAENGGAVYVNGGNATITSGMVQHNVASVNGGGAYITGGNFILDGQDAVLSDNEAVNGGGVYLTGGMPHLLQGKLTGNTASGDGGGIYINEREVNMNPTGQVTVTGNVANRGGGIFIIDNDIENDQNAGFSVADGAAGTADISSNTAQNDGGGVCISNGYFNLSSEKISLQKNKAANGGAVAVLSGDFTMTGGTIGGAENGNEAVNGGGAYISGGKFVLNGESAAISGNEAVNGGGVYLTGGMPHLLQGKLTGNTASGDGGGIYIDRQEVHMNPTAQVTVTGNVANRGGGIFIGGTEGRETPDAGFSVDAAAQGTVNISSNTATNDGGGVCISNGYFNLSSEKISLQNNKAANGGAVAVLSGDFTMTGGTIGGAEDGNEAVNGGGAYISGGKFVLNGESAAISGNEAVNGGGVYLTGGEPRLLRGALLQNEASANGGGIYIDRQLVTLTPEGTVRIAGNRAVDGAGIYIGGTEETRASFAVSKTSAGTVEICENTATGRGAGVCINNGLFTLDSERILLQRNTAVSGGAVAVLSGNFTMSNGAIGGAENGNNAEEGGAVYVDGGNAAISGGTVRYNTADVNGGGIAVNNGNIVMSGGHVDNNTALSGSGGGIYVTSAQDEVKVQIYSGYIQDNTAAVSGGAVGLKGGQTSNIEVQVGVNLQHLFTDGILTPIPHDTYLHEYCPEIHNNASAVSGGAFYVNGGAQTQLKIYCLDESDNNCSGDTDINDVHLSDFLMVEGGKVTISTAAGGGVCDGTDGEHDHGGVATDHGHAAITGSIHVAGGTLDLFGNMDNPKFDEYITVDLTKQEDHYHDHREYKDYIKLSYHENFDFNGVVDSTHTAIDLRSGEEHTISDSLYKHEGYEIYGWNTDPEATPATVGGWFDNGKTYVFVRPGTQTSDDGRNYYVCEKLTLYAIWVANGYTVSYDPNTDGEYTGERMEDQRFTYNQEQALHSNTYSRVGYLFGGWTYLDDNKVERNLSDGQSVMNLTAVKGATVVLKAVWTACTDHQITYTATPKSAQEVTVTKTCTLCQSTGTVMLRAADTVYDGISHPAVLHCSAPQWFRVDSISYQATKIGSADTVANPGETTNAGDYTATIAVPDGSTVSVTYRIAKATQSAPSEKPTYKEPEQNSKVLTIHPISTNVSGSTGLPAEYTARYYRNGVLQETEWKKATQLDGEYQDVQITLPEELKYYFVYVRYAGDDNYLPSAEVMADGTFLFEGNIKLTFEVDAGITYLPTENQGMLAIDLTVADTHYLTGGVPTIKMSENGSAILQMSEAVAAEAGEPHDFSFTIVKKPDVTISKEVNITVQIGKTKALPSVTGIIEEKQVFAPLENEGTSAQIERGSAYTVRYNVKNFDTAVYHNPVLTFAVGDEAQPVPKGTTVILQSKAGTKLTYWSYTVTAESVSGIPLEQFHRMGDSDEEFVVANGDMNLQFVVDFSRTDSGYANNALQTKLVMDKKIVDAGAPDLSGGVPLDVALASAEFTLNRESGTGLTHTLNYGVTSGFAASRWDNRELALVVTGGGLPDDAQLSARVNGIWHTCKPAGAGRFIVPVGDVGSGVVELRLQSDLFPAAQTTYSVTCQLYLSRSVAEKAAMNGDTLGRAVAFDFVTEARDVSVSVSGGEADKRLFSSSESVSVWVESVLRDGYSVNVQLHHKDQNTDAYVNTARRPEVKETQYTFSLNGCVPGSYRVVAIIERSDGWAVSEDSYYFIIQ